jgi:tRNA 2-thiouridine synthesizing protein A
MPNTAGLNENQRKFCHLNSIYALSFPIFINALSEDFYSLFIDSCFRGTIMKVKPDKTLDCLGLYCPEPVFKTRMELDEMTVGEVLEVMADDPAAEADIRSLVKHLEQEIISISKEGNAVRILVKKVK